MSISIIGAGIGGLTTALSLKKANIPFKLYEATPEIKTAGAGIVLAINALQIFKKLGIQKELYQYGNPIHKISITDKNLAPLLEIHLQKFQEQYRLQNHAIHRADLHAILSKAVGSENMVLNKRLQRVKQQNTSYRLYFEDGTRVDTTYLIGADGIHSTVREELFPKVQLRDAKQLCWRGITDFQGIPPNTAVEAWYKGKRFGFSKLNHRQMYWFLVVNADLASYEDDTQQLVKDFHPSLQQIVKTTPKDTLIKKSLWDVKPFDDWQKERACLVGDAAHATTPNLGQGACQAIEDAYILGELLKKYSIEKAFQRYPKIRRKKAHLVVNRSWQLGKAAHFTRPIAISARNFAMKRILTEKRTHRQMEKIFALEEAQ